MVCRSAGVVEYLLRKLQSMQSAAASLLTSKWRRDHITPVCRPPFIFSRNSWLFDPRTRTSFGGKKFRSCGTAPVEHFDVYVTTDDPLGRYGQFRRHVKGYLIKA